MQKPKGTYDVYGSYGRKLLYVEKVIKALMENYNYQYFRTPIFESSELFHRGVGETTDIISKETYDFKDRSDRNMTLRPEGTAGIVRSYIENKLYGEPDQPTKAWYYGPMYRYEQPQSGRYREFFQFGVEVFGSSEPMIDAEVISIPVTFYQLIGLKGIKVNINSLGDKTSRENYKQALKEYFKPHLSALCSDCVKRYETNTLRILDCKKDHDLPFMQEAPIMIDYLSESSKEHFLKVQHYLEVLGVEYEINPRLVRGLDYYTETVFEVEAAIEGFGSQNVLCGGGRYDNLVETLDGPSTSAVGFAIGIERLMSAIEFEQIEVEEEGIDVYLIPLTETEKNYAFSLVQYLRLNGFKAEIDYMNRNLKSNFKQADRIKAKFVVILGEEELKNHTVTVKNNETHEEIKIQEEFLIGYLGDNLGGNDEQHSH